MSAVSAGFRKHWRLTVFLAGLVVAAWLLYLLRSAMLPFITGLVLAYLLTPLVSWLELHMPYPGKWRTSKRIVIIAVIYVVGVGLIVLFVFYIITALVNAVTTLVNNAHVYIAIFLARLNELASFAREQFPPEMQVQVDSFLTDAGTSVANALKGVFVKGVSFVPSTFGLVLGFASLPVFLYYLLKDPEKLSRSFYSVFSPWVADMVRHIVIIIEEVLGRYIRAQLVLGFVVGYLSFVAFLALRIQFAPALAVLLGVTKVIPILGPWIGGVSVGLITLAVVPGKTIWVIAIFLAIQLLANTLISPRIQGAYLRIHPAAVLVLLMLGAYVAGFWGIVLIVPLTATVVQIYKYVRQSVKTPENNAVENNG